jgi:murein DD-endopeptidase MepM/ murein hydrolase activator NlpD
MAEKSKHVPSLLFRVLGALAVLTLVAALSPVAGAQTSTEEKLEDAEARFDGLVAEIAQQERELEALMAQAAEMWERVQAAEARYQQISEALRNTTLRLHRAQDDFAALREQLDARARETFMEGPGSEWEFLLGASSMADLSARLEYVNAISATDADLAIEVQNLKNQLAAEKQEEERLQARRAAALRKAQEERAAVEANLAEQERVLGSLEEAKREAAALVERLTRRHRRELRALTGLGGPSDGVFKYCPVAPPRAVYDGFGAPRYGGGYHPHAGNDIMAPMGTAIIATFDGTARTSTNGLGGYAVYVYGEHGYTYNAHLMQPGVNGSVNAGDVIGYVGTTGNASTPHNHFEWHPYQTPSAGSWPVSPYGYSVIGSAVNPWPLLSQVC